MLVPLLQDVPLMIPGLWSWYPEKNEFHAPLPLPQLSEEKAREHNQECYDRFIKVNAYIITDGQVNRSLISSRLTLQAWNKNFIVLYTKSISTYEHHLSLKVHDWFFLT